MAAMLTIERNDLAELAAVAFHGDGVDDIPEKIWCDAYENVVFVRATWASGLTARRTDHLELLRDLVADTYRVEASAVAYWHDMTWEQIDALAAVLQLVR